jgi:hypothetical protein
MADPVAESGQNHFDACLKTYKITDFEMQILRYPETYRDFVQSKLMTPAEFGRSMKDGFYFGHRTAGLGEFLSFSALPRLLKKHYPGTKVWVGPNRFAESVFKNDPNVDGIGEQAGREPFGSQKEFGFGTTTQRRLLPMGLFSSRPIGPEMTLTNESVVKAQAWRNSLDLKGRKLVFIQSSGRTNPKVFSFFKWSYWLWKLREEFCFVQIGNLRDQFIWAENVMLKQWKIEEMAALLKVGDAFVGPNSGVMHLASAVGTRAVVMHNEALASEVVFPVLGDNEKLPGPVNHHLFHCYPWHHHLVVERLFDQNSPFSEKATLENLRAVLREACIRENDAWSALKVRFENPIIKLL